MITIITVIAVITIDFNDYNVSYPAQIGAWVCDYNCRIFLRHPSCNVHNAMFKDDLISYDNLQYSMMIWLFVIFNDDLIISNVQRWSVIIYDNFQCSNDNLILYNVDNLIRYPWYDIDQLSGSNFPFIWKELRQSKFVTIIQTLKTKLINWQK